MSATVSSQLSTWAERHPGAKVWPGDIRPLWTRALERRQYEQRVEVFCGKTKRARWSQIGQAMPPPLAEAVGRSIAVSLRRAKGAT